MLSPYLNGLLPGVGSCLCDCKQVAFFTLRPSSVHCHSEKLDCIISISSRALPALEIGVMWAFVLMNAETSLVLCVQFGSEAATTDKGRLAEGARKCEGK